MKKIKILLIAVIVIGVGFLSGCMETAVDDESDGDLYSEPEKETYYLQFGELVYLTDGCAFTVEEVKTTIDYVGVSDNGYVYTYKPDDPNYGYLWVSVSAENKGNDIADSPSYYYMKLLVSGVEMERDTPTYSMSGLYDDIDLNPGAKSEGWIIYSISKNARDVQFVFELSNAYEIWNIDDSKVIFQERNFGNLADGESITYGSDEDYYEMSLTHDKTVYSYSYQSSYGDYIFTEDASPGNKFVFIEVYAKNMGSRKIDVPCPYDMKLIAGGKQYSYESYYGENRYRDSCGDIYPGITAEGKVVFEVPDSISEAIVMVELTSEQEASWIINV